MKRQTGLAQAIIKGTLFLLRCYKHALRLTGILPLIYKSDRAFRIYVKPFHLYHILRRRHESGLRWSYVTDILFNRVERNRGGDCNLCGACCGDCHHLVAGPETGQYICNIYARREWCDIYFPATAEQLEKAERNGKIRCTFTFHEKVIPIAITSGKSTSANRAQQN